MAIAIYDRVQETTDSSGTTTVTLNGAVAGYLTFNETVGVGYQTYYGIIDSTASAWEIGVGTLTSSTLLTRNTVLSSSNSNASVDFTGNTSFVFIDVPADKRIQVDNGNAILPFQLNGAIANNSSGSTIYEIDFNGNPKLQNADSNEIFGVDSNSNPFITSTIGDGGLGFDGSNNPVLVNTAGNIIISMDGSNNIQILNAAGSHVFTIDGNGNPQIISGDLPGFEGSIIAYDDNNNPYFTNSEGDVLFGADGSGRPKIWNSTYPVDAQGALTNDGSGNLSWGSSYRQINNQTGTTYTLQASDAGKMVTLSNTSAITVTIPADTFSALVEIDLLSLNTGVVTVAGADGVTLLSYLNNTNIAGQYAASTIKQISSDTWIMIGNLS